MFGSQTSPWRVSLLVGTFLRMKSFSLTAAITRILCAIYCLSMLAGEPAAAADKKKKGEAAEAEAAREAPPKTTTRCEVDVFYTWKRVERQKTNGAEAGGREEKEPDPALLEPVEVFYARPGQSGETQELAQEKLLAKLPELQSEARAVCERSHQSESLCIMGRLREATREYRLLDFQARKQFLDSVAEDCRRNVGICIGTRVGEPRCAVERAAGPAAAAEGKTEADSGEKKKKK